jgi:hypothetical protein
MGQMYRMWVMPNTSLAQRGENLGYWGVVGAVGVEVGVANVVAGADDEGGADLAHALTGFVYVVAALRGFACCLPRFRMHQLGPAECLDRRSSCGCSIVVDQYGERNFLIANETFGVSPITGSDGNDRCAEGRDLVVSVAQLRDMLAAMQSTKMPKEHKYHRSLIPKVTEAMRHPGAIGE